LAESGTARGCHTVVRVGDTTFANDNSSFMHFYGTLGFEHIDVSCKSSTAVKYLTAMVIVRDLIQIFHIPIVISRK
jgi:hypothetical protein